MQTETNILLLIKEPFIVPEYHYKSLSLLLLLLVLLFTRKYVCLNILYVQ